MCANALVATMLLVLAFLRSWKRLASGQKRLAKFAASTNAQARYVAVLDVAFAFLLAIAGVHAVDAARVGCEVADVGEPIDRTSFQKNDGRERLADARYAGQQAVLRSGLYAFLQALLQNLDL